MNRRAFFAGLAGVPLLPTAADAEKPLTYVSPACPRCGLAAWFDPNYDLDLRAPRTVQCSCGWRGECPRVVPIP